MNLFQAIRGERSAVSHPIGPIATVLCEGRGCRDRTAPVFVALGVRGALALCAECRAWQNRVIRAVLPELKRSIWLSPGSSGLSGLFGSSGSSCSFRPSNETHQRNQTNEMNQRDRARTRETRQTEGGMNIQNEQDLHRANIQAAWGFSHKLSAEQFEQLCQVTVSQWRRDAGVTDEPAPAAA